MRNSPALWAAAWRAGGVVVALPNDDAPERWVYVPGVLSPSRVALAISERHRAALSRLLFDAEVAQTNI